MHVKIVCHPALPLAFATSGVGELDHVNVSRHLQQFATGITGADLGNKPQLIAKIDAYFGPLVQQEKGFPEYPDPAKVVLGLSIAWYNGAQIDGGVVLVDPPSATALDELLFRIGADDPILEVLLQQFNNEDTIAGEHLADPNGLAAHFRNVIHVGAEAERTVQKNRCLTTGGRVDVALVDPAGARRL
jgi:hypothetical protein